MNACLLFQGLSVTEITEGYELACKKALELLPDLEVAKVKDLSNREDVMRAVRTAIMSKQYGNEDFLAGLITDACSELN